MDLNGKNTLVIGLGKSGLAAAMLLLAQGARVCAYDSSKHEIISQRAELVIQEGGTVRLGDFDFHLESFDLCVISPGIDPRGEIGKSLKASKISVISEIELASKFVKGQIIAITGTNGKSTTTELICSILVEGGKKAIACGNLGKPLAEVALEGEEWDAIVLEVSSFQLEAIESFRPRVAVYLNLTPDHLDRYDSFDDYKLAKLKIFNNQEASDLSVVNANLDLPKLVSEKRSFSSEGLLADYGYQNKRLYAADEVFIDQGETHLLGPHNAENQLAAIAVSQWLEIKDEVIRKGLREYRPLAHRCEVVKSTDGITYINDSKATNIDAMKKAILAQDGPVILIAGGKDKGLDFQSVSKVVAKKLVAAVLIGEAKEKIVAAWGEVVSCELASSLRDALLKAKSRAKAGDVILFSPGCSSFDMFNSFEDRGNQYIKLVEELA